MRTTKDIVIPAGTQLLCAPDQRGGSAYVEATVGLGKDFCGSLLLQVHPDLFDSGYVDTEGEKRCPKTASA